ncbi:hypothetical protein SDC9_209336 [bioreactor metagenome]|uniref:Uncharacterized protein n=1 Tax=bioreactor metagenome TaxID=1076179 RepID=A0A645JD24_9ZZZZ
MRYGALRHLQKRGDIANAHLVGKQAVEDLDARAVAKQLEKLAQVKQRILAGHGLLDALHHAFVHADILALEGFLLGGHTHHSFI